MRMPARQSLATWMFACIACSAAGLNAESDETEQKKEHELSLRRMARCAQALSVVEVGEGEDRQAALIDKPVLRWNDAARQHPDGTLWIWQSRGRPVAVMEIFQTGFDDLRIWHCGNSLSTGRVVLRRHDAVLFAAQTPGVDYQPFQAGPPPGETKVARMRQIKQLAGRFTAHEFWRPGNTRYQLRLLPQPVYHYEAADLGVLDGAIFVFCHSTNPEAALLIELVQDGDADPKWQFALARIGHAEFHVLLDEQEVWTKPRADVVPPGTAYWLFVTPPPDVEN